MAGFGPPIAWFSPSVSRDRATLARWRGGVGLPVVSLRESTATGTDEVLLISWNTNIGAGDIVRFVESLPHPSAPMVLLLQEVFRGGPEVPARLEAGASHAGRHGGAPYREIDATAEALGFSLYYVPSMRNGGPASDEDRGNAILSNLPLGDLTAIELPFERQRRVAVAATVAGRTTAGVPWTLRVVSAHLDNRMGARRAWIAGEHGRARQARGLAGVLGSETPTILAGDFNTWSGFSEQAYTETAVAFPDTRVTDKRATFHGLLRLDHVFYRLAAGWRAEFRRGNDRFGSDHYPLLGAVRFR